MKIQIDTDDVFFTGGNYDRIQMIREGAVVHDDMEGRDAFWFVKVRKGTPTHKAIQKCFGQGEQSQGKSVAAGWLMRLWGFATGKTRRAPPLVAQHSKLPTWMASFE